MSIQIDGREAIVEADCGTWARVYYPETDTEGFLRVDALPDTEGGR